MRATLIDHMGTDSTVVNSARVSFHKEALSFSPEQNERLIKYLAKHNHWTPFSHCMITLREKVPIFVARQRFKSTVGFSYNEISRRYVDDEPEFYTPDIWRKRAENKKQGSSDEAVERLWDYDDLSGPKYGAYIKDRYNKLMQEVKNFYDEMLDAQVAPEQARMVLPQSLYTEYFCTGSLAAFARAYKLRSEESAQKEIQDLSEFWDKLIRPLFPKSWSALVD